MTKKTNKKKADAFAESIRPIIQDLIADGAGLRRITSSLNWQEIRPRFGDRWHKTQVHRLLKRLDLKTKTQAAYAAGEIMHDPSARYQFFVPKDQRAVHPSYAAKQRRQRLADFGDFAKPKRPRLVKRKRG